MEEEKQEITETKTEKTSQVALKGMIWAFAERICAQLVTLIVSIVLARLLSPSEYAVVAIVTIFVTIANVFVTAGFGSALVQKKDADETDFSTTFYFSLVFSILIYFVLFFTAPLIADFYDMPILTLIIRIMSLRIVVASVNSIQQAFVAKTLQFKKFFYSTLIGTFASAVVGLTMAYLGCGVWALVGQYLTNVTIDTIVLSFTCGWKPKLIFVPKRMKSLFSYGWKVMAASVFHTLSTEARSLTISKIVSEEDLSYYNQGEKFPALFINNIETSIQKVMAPIVAREQNDVPRVLELTRKSMVVATFITWPMLIGLAAVASPFIEILYTSKWLGSVPYLQLICLAYLFYPVGETHVRTLRALGFSGITLITVFAADALNIILLIIAFVLKLGGKEIVISWIISSVAMALFNGIADWRIVKYKFIDQIKDLLFTGISCAAMFAAVYAFSYLNLNLILKLVCQVFLGVTVYLLVSFLINRRSLIYVFRTGKDFLGRFRKKSR